MKTLVRRSQYFSQDMRHSGEVVSSVSKERGQRIRTTVDDRTPVEDM
ncbi:hypothetical protein J2853_007047 [Streptosporangium lutulentum]|uniref:Uncharacterized protein n=1 Tax=Streptosporangium lutulentum TaxID=1461250 RepID=A0ABT9QN67_9ACTN|nr:hypothetical protein [Streptosporangium lutulentum]